MFGDHPGSPRRDDPLNLDSLNPPTRDDDVRVAGPPPGDAPSAGDTASLPPVPPGGPLSAPLSPPEPPGAAGEPGGGAYPSAPFQGAAAPSGFDGGAFAPGPHPAETPMTADEAPQTRIDAFEPIPAASPDPGAEDVLGAAQPMGPPGPSSPGPGRRARPGGKRTGLRIAAVAAGAAVVVGGGAIAALALTGGGDGGKATVKPSTLADAAQPSIDPQALERARRAKAASRAEREADAKDADRPKLLPRGTPLPTKKPEPEGGGGGGPVTEGDPVPAGEAQRIARNMMGDFGFDPDTQFGCLVKLWDKESGWNYKASNPSSGAYGIPQALPGSKMATAGDDWRTNPATQIKWGLGYIKNRYGSPCEAWAHSKSVGWY